MKPKLHNSARRFSSPTVLRGDAPFLGATVQEWDKAIVGNMDKTLAQVNYARWVPARSVTPPRPLRLTWLASQASAWSIPSNFLSFIRKRSIDRDVVQLSAKRSSVRHYIIDCGEEHSANSRAKGKSHDPALAGECLLELLASRAMHYRPRPPWTLVESRVVQGWLNFQRDSRPSMTPMPVRAATSRPSATFTEV